MNKVPKIKSLALYHVGGSTFLAAGILVAKKLPDYFGNRIPVISVASS
jgi:hypothetical protein